MATIKQIPKPPHEPLENPEFQQHAGKEMRRTQKKIKHIQPQKNIHILARLLQDLQKTMAKLLNLRQTGLKIRSFI